VSLNADPLFAWTRASSAAKQTAWSLFSAGQLQAGSLYKWIKWAGARPLPPPHSDFRASQRRASVSCASSCKLKSVTLSLIYLLTAHGLTPRGSSTVHIYTQTIHRTAQLTNWEECGPCPVFVSYILAVALQLSKNHGKTSVSVAEECKLARWRQNIQNRTYITIRIHNLTIRIRNFMFSPCIF